MQRADVKLQLGPAYGDFLVSKKQAYTISHGAY